MSLSPQELSNLVKDIKNTEISLGSYFKKICKSEKMNKILVRQSIHAKNKINKVKYSQKILILKN